MGEPTMEENNAESMPISADVNAELVMQGDDEELTNPLELETSPAQPEGDTIQIENAPEEAPKQMEQKETIETDEINTVDAERKLSQEEVVDDRAKETLLTDTLARFTIEQEQEPEADTEILEDPIGIPTSMVHEPLFPTILFSNDRIHPETTTMKLLNSPKPAKNHDFVNVDFNVDADEFKLEMGLTMSRSGSIESLQFNPKELLFSKIDTDLEPPRIGTPTQETNNAPIESPTIAENETVNLESIPKQEEEGKDITPPDLTINRDEIIKLICKDLELKEKLTSKNTTLQNKLAELFKRKRVSVV
jgi:hypothetical protein